MCLKYRIRDGSPGVSGAPLGSEFAYSAADSARTLSSNDRSPDLGLNRPIVKSGRFAPPRPMAKIATRAIPWHSTDAFKIVRAGRVCGLRWFGRECVPRWWRFATERGEAARSIDV